MVVQLSKRRQQEEVKIQKMNRKLMRMRVGDVGLDVLPTSEIVIPFRLRERVIFDQMHQGQRMIVFCSQFGINSLANFRNEVAIDGTFETCPRGFAQLYTMSVIIDHCAIPVVYGLLSNKNVGAYSQFFEAIRNAVAPDWNPNRMMSDFEAAALNAASAVFPNTFRSGCLFHLGQCIFRRIQRLPQLFARYNADDGFKSSLRSLQALAFVPLPYVYNYFCILAYSLEPTNEMRELLLYFVNTWIGPQHIVENEELIVDENAGHAADGWIRSQIEAMNLQHANALFPMPIWNMCDRLAEGMGRTNNSVEGWHAIWNTYLKGNQRLASFFRKMISEDEMWAQRVEDFQASPADGIRGPHTSRRAKYVRQDNNLLALLNDFENRV